MFSIVLKSFKGLIIHFLIVSLGRMVSDRQDTGLFLISQQ